MTAKLIEQILTESDLHMIHGMSYPAKRLLIAVPEGMLVVTQDSRDVLHAFVTEKFEGDYKTLGEVEISAVFVANAMAIVTAQKEFQGYGPWFKSEFSK